MKPNLTKMQVRLPIDVREWLGNQVDHYGGSLNGTIIRLVRERMEREQSGRPANHG